MYNDNNENDSQYRYSGSDIPYNNTNNGSTSNNNTAFSSAPYEAKKHKKHKRGFAKKAACFVLSAVLFGAIAGSVMFGVNYAGGKIAGSNKSDATGVNIPTVSNNISNVAKTDSSLTEDTNLSASGKMDAEAVATAALPAMVQLNGTTTVKSSSYFGYGQSYEATSSGTGIIVGKSDTELLIVTNAHVVDNIDNLKCVFSDARNKHPEETVEKILAVSAKLFMEKGYEHTTLQDIIDNLGGLTKGAIYHHFKGKEEILLAIADRMGEQTEAWMRTVRDDPGLTGAEKLQKMFRASLENSDQTDLFVLAPNMLKNPKLMSILLESMIGEVLPNYMEPVLREAVADGSIRTDYPEELGELLLLLSNVWLNPMIYPATPEKTRRRMELYDQMLRSMGLDLLDQELLNQWERFCRLSQERL